VPKEMTDFVNVVVVSDRSPGMVKVTDSWPVDAGVSMPRELIGVEYHEMVIVEQRDDVGARLYLKAMLLLLLR
jgi:hypothetical protein